MVALTSSPSAPYAGAAWLPYVTMPPGAAPFADLCAQRLFELQAARTPAAAAVTCGERQLSYRQLNEQANQLAHYLRRRHVGPGTLVGVALRRSPEMVVALLAVWKAGGAYVPLDPGYPPDRLAFMVRDAGLRLLLTEQAVRPQVAHATAKAICVDSDAAAIALERTDNPAASATLTDLAYVMYTSGSSGQPKGAMVTHGGLVNYLDWAIATYGFSPCGTVPLHSSISFDLTVTSLYPPLLVGGQVELLAEDRGAQNLLAALRAGRHYDVLKITPAHLELLSRQLQPEEMAAMSRVFVIGGEALTAESLRPWRRHAPQTRIFNEYGPTETVVGCCVHEVQTQDPDSGAVPIGRPIAATELYVLDAALRQVAAGIPGELYIGGAGVARGYLNRPQLTAERFIADPFSGRPGARLYKTGDLARMRSDGVLEYLGRIDGQVKVGGYRIELAEVEAHIAAFGDAQSCAVLAPENAPGERQLVAYVVLRADAEADASALQGFLKRRLPEFMVPARYVFLDAMPLTDNGKIDRQALVDGTAARRAMPVPPAVARTPVEEKLVAIWCETLRLEVIGLDDDVFDLGLGSLQAVKAVTQIRSAFGIELQLRHLFEQPTVAGLAGMIEGLLWLSQPLAPKRDVRELEEIEL